MNVFVDVIQIWLFILIFIFSKNPLSFNSIIFSALEVYMLLICVVARLMLWLY